MEAGEECSGSESMHSSVGHDTFGQVTFSPPYDHFQLRDTTQRMGRLVNHGFTQRSQSIMGYHACGYGYGYGGISQQYITTEAAAAAAASSSSAAGGGGENRQQLSLVEAVAMQQTLQGQGLGLGLGQGITTTTTTTNNNNNNNNHNNNTTTTTSTAYGRMVETIRAERMNEILS